MTTATAPAHPTDGHIVRTSGAEYQLYWGPFTGRYTVTQDGRVAGWLELSDDRRWNPWVPAQFGDVTPLPKCALPETRSLDAAVAAIHAHWASPNRTQR
jgi:hypothetical protein